MPKVFTLSLILFLLAFASDTCAQSGENQAPTKQHQKRKVTSFYSPEPDWKFNTYASLVTDNVVSKQYYTSSIGTSVSTVREEENQVETDVSLGFLAGVSGEMRNGQRLGLMIGSSFGVLSLRPKLLGDLSLSFGPDQRLVALAGISIGRIRGLSSSVFQNDWGMVYSHRDNTVTEVPMADRTKLGFSFGIGWRLGK